MTVPTQGHDSIWQFYQCDVLIYLEASDGSLLNDDGSPAEDEGSAVPLSINCYMEGVTVKGTLESERRPVTGRSKKKITTRAYEYSLQAEYLYIDKDTQLDLANIFNRQQRLRLVLACTEPGVVTQKHTLYTACAISWELSGSDNESLIFQSQFEAEDFS